jgi:proteasome lid subunit RPN8/RPN11
MSDGSPGDADFTLAPRKREGKMGSPDAIPEHAMEPLTRFNLYIDDRVVIGVRLHVSKDPEREAGGVLIGKHYQRGEVTLVSITGFVPLPSGSASAVHFTFDEVALVALHKRTNVAGEYPVGWFHSHPNLGDPFMSMHDIDLHRHYFKKPWHVSCVVGVGEWSVPLGFWRLDGDELITIEEHFTRMTKTVPPAEQSRRFLRACDAEKRSLGELISRIQPILGDLGFDARGALGRALAFAGDKENAPHVLRSTVARPIAALAALAQDIARNPETLAELTNVEDRLRIAKFEEDALLKVIRVDGLPDRITVLGDACYAVTPGTSQVYSVDFNDNTFIPVHLKPMPELADLDSWSDGSVWVISRSGQLARFPSPEPDAMALSLRDTGTIPVQVLAPCELSGTVEELSVMDQSMLIRTPEQLYRFELPSVSSLARGATLTQLERVALPAPGCVLMKTWNAARPSLITMCDGRLLTFDSSGQAIASARAPQHWQRWTLRAACRSALGIHVVFDDGNGGQLVLLKEDSLQPAAYYLHGADRRRKRYRSVSVAGDGRVFVHKGDTIFLLADTGALSATWFRTLETAFEEARG